MLLSRAIRSVSMDLGVKRLSSPIAIASGENYTPGSMRNRVCFLGSTIWSDSQRVRTFLSASGLTIQRSHSSAMETRLIAFREPKDIRSGEVRARTKYLPQRCDPEINVRKEVREDF